MVDIISRGQTVNSNLYIQTLKILQKPFWRVRTHKNVAEILLQHDNARPHRKVKTQATIPELGWTVLPFPPRNLHLAPSHFLFFGAFKDAVCGKRFGNDDEVIEGKAANTIFKLVCKRRGLMFFPPGARLLNLMEIT
jgi:hypothetical protein